jgi:hypothetical protein
LGAASAWRTLFCSPGSRHSHRHCWGIAGALTSGQSISGGPPHLQAAADELAVPSLVRRQKVPEHDPAEQKRQAARPESQSRAPTPPRTPRRWAARLPWAAAPVPGTAPNAQRCSCAQCCPEGTTSSTPAARAHGRCKPTPRPMPCACRPPAAGLTQPVQASSIAPPPGAFDAPTCSGPVPAAAPGSRPSRARTDSPAGQVGAVARQAVQTTARKLILLRPHQQCSPGAACARH